MSRHPCKGLIAVRHTPTRSTAARGAANRRPSSRVRHRAAGHGGFWALFFVASAGMALGCQDLDPNLSTGWPVPTRVSPTAEGGSVLPPVVVDTGEPPPAAPDAAVSVAPRDASTPPSCEATRAQARAVLATQCAYCHQAPGNERSVYATGQFNFILELDKITTLKSNVFTGTSYVAARDAAGSLIYQRAINGTMPPLNVAQRPSAGDLAQLRQWIDTCVDGASTGWPPPPEVSTVDAGENGDADIGIGCGLPGQACCAANVCAGGGCCVGGLCRENGLTCAAPPPRPGGPQEVSLPGTCSSGACAVGDPGVACGRPSQPCCDFGICTASQSSCLTGTTTCSACGDTGQPCCKPNSCLDGRACLNGGVGRIGTCALCGAKGQPCCGSGSAAQQTCDAELTCGAAAGMGNLCSTGVIDGGSARDR